MRYYIQENTYIISPDGAKTLCDSVKGSIEDREGNMLSTAEQKFYNKIADEMEFESENCTPDTSGNDYLYTQTWTLDAEGTMIALALSITESQIRRNMAFCDMNIRAEMADEMTGASLIGDAVVQSTYSDVEFERERLWKRRDGRFVMEISRKFTVDNQIYWESEKQDMTPSNAKAWAKKHLNPMAYKALFGDIAENDDRVPAGMMIRKDHKEMLKQKATQEGKSFNELLDEALVAYLQ